MLRAGALLALALLVLPANGPRADVTVEAGVEEIRYRIDLAGVTIARFGLNALMAEGRYSLAGRMEAVGLAAILHPVSYDARTEGEVTPDGLRPGSYHEAARTPRRATRTEVVWVAGLPRRIQAEPPGAFSDLPDPADQGGSIDILTGLYLILRAQPEAEVCTLSDALYDGRRPSVVAIDLVAPAHGAFRCEGRFLRPAREGEAESAFQFEAEYRSGPDGLLRPEMIRLGSILGRVVMHREGRRCTVTVTC
jgi:hypothetical protein